MRIKEYIELAKRSLKLRKKSNRATIIALSLGFALTVPVIVALFGVNVSLNAQLNETPYLLYYDTCIADYRIDTDDYIREDGGAWQISGSKHIDYITDKKNAERTIIYEQYFITENSSTSIKLGDGEYLPILTEGKPSYSIIDIDKSDCIFPKNLTDYYEGGIFLKGYDKGFTDSGKKQVVLSERFLLSNGYSPDDVYLKDITIKANAKLSLSANKDEYESVEGYLCNEYTVVGIIKSEIAEIYNQYNNNLMCSDLFFTDVNVYDADGNAVLKPYYCRYGKKYYERYLVYDNFADKDRLNQEYMMIGLTGADLISGNYIDTYGNTCVYGESNGYARLVSDINGLNGRFTAALGDNHDIVKVSEVFDKYSLIYNVANIVSLILLVVGLVLGVSALINMYCSISHSVTERRYYLTMMRAIGAKDKVVPRLYMTESVITSAKACAFIAIIGFLLSMSIKLIFDKVLKANNVSYNLSIPWWTIFVTLLAVIIFVFAVGILISYFLTKRLSKSKITDILNDV